MLYPDSSVITMSFEELLLSSPHIVFTACIIDTIFLQQLPSELQQSDFVAIKEVGWPCCFHSTTMTTTHIHAFSFNAYRVLCQLHLQTTSSLFIQKQSKGNSGIEGSVDRAMSLPRRHPNVFTVLTFFEEAPCTSMNRLKRAWLQIFFF